MEDGEGTNKQFSGKIKDETNLNYFEARHLDGDKGRFNEVDLEVTNVALSDNQIISLAEPQRLNGYSYALSNPLKYEDRDGNFVFLVPILLNPAAAMLVATAGVSAAVSAYNMYHATKNFVQANYDKVENYTTISIISNAAVLPVAEMALVTNIDQNRPTVSNTNQQRNSYRYYDSFNKLTSNNSRIRNESTGTSLKITQRSLDHILDGHVNGTR